MSNTDKQAKHLNSRGEHTNIGEVLRSDGEIKCPHSGCECPYTHVVDVVWEMDPAEGDRRRVRLEVRCEDGHGFLLLIRNHAGSSWLAHHSIEGEVSPFEEGSRW